jgi:hypothetical protein
MLRILSPSLPASLPPSLPPAFAYSLLLSLCISFLFIFSLLLARAYGHTQTCRENCRIEKYLSVSVSITSLSLALSLSVTQTWRRNCRIENCTYNRVLPHVGLVARVCYTQSKLTKTDKCTYIVFIYSNIYIYIYSKYLSVFVNYI